MVFQLGMMGGGAGIMLVSAVIGIFVSALFLMLSAMIFKLKDRSYRTALVVAAIVGAVVFVFGFIPFLGMLAGLVAIALGLYLVKRYYKLDWGKAALVWLVWFGLGIAASFVVGMLFAGAMFGGMMQNMMWW